MLKTSYSYGNWYFRFTYNLQTKYNKRYNCKSKFAVSHAKSL
jgi:hypothetical protein